MKLLYVHKKSPNEIQTFYYVVVDEISEITYERIGIDYVGSAVDDKDNIIFSKFLTYERDGNAFGGRKLNLKMKNGEINTIEKKWFDSGIYKKHGDFINIGLSTVDELKKCYLYSSYNINLKTFEKMLREYYKTNREYEYYEIEKIINKKVEE